MNGPISWHGRLAGAGEKMSTEISVGSQARESHDFDLCYNLLKMLRKLIGPKIA
jgi:hypothetical protein